MEKKVVEAVQKELNDYTKRTKLRIIKAYEHQIKDIVDFDDIVYSIVEIMNQ